MRKVRLAVLIFCSLRFASAIGLQLDGNDHLPRKKIEAALSLPDNPAEMSREDWDEFVDETASAISDLYGEIGYLDAAIKVDPPVVDTSKAAEAGAKAGSKPVAKNAEPPVVVHIREGIRYKFGKVAILPSDQSRPVIDAGKLRSRPGRPFEKDLVFRDRRDLLNAYGDAGFIHAKSSETITPDTLGKTIDLEFHVDRGPAIVFDSLIIRDNREGDTTGKPGVTSTRLLKSLLGLQAGDTVGQDKLSNFERRLKSTRAFNYVRLRDTLVDTGRGRSALTLATEERVPGEAEASLFYETQYGAGVATTWSHGNILGHLYEGRLGGSWAQRKQSVFLGFSSPLVFGTSVRLDNDLVTNWYQDGDLVRDEPAFKGDFDITNSLKLSRVFAAWLRGLANIELTGISQHADSNTLNRAFNLNFINTGFFSFVDNGVTPNKGVRWSLTWGNGGSLIDRGEIQTPLSRRHNWLEVESAYYLPLAERLKLAFRADGGRFFGDGDLNDERFFLGGPRSVRSYGWRQLCPEKDASGEVCLTDNLEPAYFLTSFEVRANPFTSAFINPERWYGFLLGVQVVPFVDYGQVWAVGHPLTSTGEGRAFGLGLRYSLLSIFNLRLDYAVDGPERRHEQWILDLAQAF